MGVGKKSVNFPPEHKIFLPCRGSYLSFFFFCCLTQQILQFIQCLNFKVFGEEEAENMEKPFPTEYIFIVFNVRALFIVPSK